MIQRIRVCTTTRCVAPNSTAASGNATAKRSSTNCGTAVCAVMCALIFIGGMQGSVALSCQYKRKNRVSATEILHDGAIFLSINRFTVQRHEANALI